MLFQFTRIGIAKTYLITGEEVSSTSSLESDQKNDIQYHDSVFF